MARGEDLNSGVHWERYHVTYHGRDNVKDSAREAIDLIGAFDNYLKCTDGSIGSNAGTNKFDLLPQLDLSLRRSLPSVSVNQIADERHRLNHSDASAFSRLVSICGVSYSLYFLLIVRHVLLYALLVLAVRNIKEAAIRLKARNLQYHGTLSAQ